MKANIPILFGVLLVVGGCCTFVPTPKNPVVCDNTGIHLYGPKLSREDEAQVRQLLNSYNTPYRVEVLTCRLFQLSQEVLGKLPPSVARSSVPRHDIGLTSYTTTGISTHSTVIPLASSKNAGDKKTYRELKAVLCKYNGANPVSVLGSN